MWRGSKMQSGRGSVMLGVVCGGSCVTCVLKCRHSGRSKVLDREEMKALTATSKRSAVRPCLKSRSMSSTRVGVWQEIITDLRSRSQTRGGPSGTLSRIRGIPIGAVRSTFESGITLQGVVGRIATQSVPLFTEDLVADSMWFARKRFACNRLGHRYVASGS